MDWDQKINDPTGGVREALDLFLKHYTIGSIQSLTYGLAINLADSLIDHPELLIRLKALVVLAQTTACSTLILGSPGQKKILSSQMSHSEHKQQFISNCQWMARQLGCGLNLSLEHNVGDQGAEYCNTLGDMMDVVTELRQNGTKNVGINLDTKCLLHEFGTDVKIDDILSIPGLLNQITSIQVSYDFLARDASNQRKDQQRLRELASARKLPLSLEEFGLLENQLTPFITAWNQA